MASEVEPQSEARAALDDPAYEPDRDGPDTRRPEIREQLTEIRKSIDQLVGRELSQLELIGDLRDHLLGEPAFGGAGGRAKTSADWIMEKFTYHEPDDTKQRGGSTQTQRQERILATARSLACVIERLVPDSDDRDVAFRKLREAVMFAAAAIATEE